MATKTSPEYATAGNALLLISNNVGSCVLVDVSVFKLRDDSSPEAIEDVVTKVSPMIDVCLWAVRA